MPYGRYLNMENLFKSAFKFITRFIIWYVLFYIILILIGIMVKTFFKPGKDVEKVDVNTVITVPDQSLSVRDILTRFSRGQIQIPPVDYGDDDDIDAPLGDFEDYVDAYDSIDRANRSMAQENIKSASKNENKPDVVEQSETNKGDEVLS